MADGFEAMVDTARAFLTELGDNNTKEWFDPRRDHYTTEIRKPAELFAEIMAEDLSRLSGQALAPKVFRIHRDVRFSKDKTPYKVHLHIMWSEPKSKGPSPVWYWGLSPDYLLMGAGLVQMKGPDLTAYRAHVDAHGEKIEAALAEAGEVGALASDWGPEPLQRVPKPYAQDHPQAELLKRKALAVNAPLPENWREDGLVKASMGVARRLAPVAAALRI